MSSLESWPAVDIFVAYLEVPIIAFVVHSEESTVADGEEACIVSPAGSMPFPHVYGVLVFFLNLFDVLSDLCDGLTTAPRRIVGIVVLLQVNTYIAKQGREKC